MPYCKREEQENRAVARSIMILLGRQSCYKYVIISKPAMIGRFDPNKTQVNRGRISQKTRTTCHRWQV